MFNIIFAACVVPIWPILYFVFRNLVKPKKNVIIGVTLPENERDNTDVQTICRSYLKWLNITLLPQLPLFIAPFFMSSMGLAMTWYMTLLLLLIVAPFVVFAVHHGKLLALKRENGWYSEAVGKIAADIKATMVPAKRISGIWFLIPAIISLLPIADSIINPNATVPDYLWVYVTFSVMIVSFWMLYYMIFRVRAEAVNENLSLTTALTRVRRQNWGKFWLVSVWSTGALNLVIWIFSDNVMAFLIATIVYTLVLITVAIATEFSTRNAQQQLTATGMGEAYIDDDDYWLWGMFYNNPNDNHLLVNARIGMNMSVNLAKTGGKILMLFAVIMLAAMPFIGVWIWVEEATPTALVLTDTDLVARHVGTRYVIPLDSIESIELLTEMPTVLSRVAGSSFENLAKGRFLVSNHGTSTLCIQTNDPPFIMIITNDRTYFINDANSSVTTGVYNEITSGPNSN
ncbi:MAG: PH domain-containing protein [Oscillospiraceae bacterium]|nr:PH domain-containing protein [Oscillospiraceae bacterium]